MSIHFLFATKKQQLFIFLRFSFSLFILFCQKVRLTQSPCLMLLLTLPTHFEDHQDDLGKSVCVTLPFQTAMGLIPSCECFPSELCHSCHLKFNFVICKCFSPDIFKRIIDFCDHGSVYVSRSLAILNCDEILQEIFFADILFSYVLFLHLAKGRKFWAMMQ